MQRAPWFSKHTHSFNSYIEIWNSSGNFSRTYSNKWSYQWNLWAFSWMNFYWLYWMRIQMFMYIILYKYWLHEKVTWKIVIPIKPMSTSASLRLTLVLSGWQVPIIIIILYWMLIKYIVYITFGFKTIHVKWIFEFVFHTP